MAAERGLPLGGLPSEGALATFGRLGQNSRIASGPYVRATTGHACVPSAALGLPERFPVPVPGPRAPSAAFAGRGGAATERFPPDSPPRLRSVGTRGLP